MNKKYEITNITMVFEGRTLYRIIALKNFSDVKAGELGGWVSNEYNLSQYGDCWIYNEAKCMDGASMYNNSCMYENAVMYDNAIMYDNSMMFGHSRMFNNSEMHDFSEMRDNSVMYNNTEMHDYSEIYGDSEMHGHSEMHDCSKMYNNSKMYDYSIMHGNSAMYEDSEMHDKEVLYGKLASKVDEFVEISIPKGRIVTGVLKDKKILYNIGCQSEITKETFIKRIYNEGGGIEKNPHRKSYLKIIDIIEAYFSK